MLRKFELEINYSFKNRDLLKRSLTHKSSDSFENNINARVVLLSLRQCWIGNIMGRMC